MHSNLMDFDKCICSQSTTVEKWHERILHTLPDDKKPSPPHSPKSPTLVKRLNYLAASMEDIMSQWHWALKKILKLEANTVLSIKSFGNGIVSGRLVAVVFFTTAFRMSGFLETICLSEKSRLHVIWTINHQNSRIWCKIPAVRVIHVLSHSLIVS